jgi:phosphohistidine swiveling domain-containing protein
MNAAVRGREWTKDVTMRATHALRLTMREIGRRAVADGNLGEVADIFFLTSEETTAIARNADVIGPRRAEYRRLSALNLPSMFTLNWQPGRNSAVAPSKTLTLQGIGVSPGIAQGPARVLRQNDVDIEPGEVLVASATDVGYTPLFGLASAVVTDVGGMQSHAAIVAREFGIPCVVSTQTATRDIHQGQWVTVNGATGYVTAERSEPQN